MSSNSPSMALDNIFALSTCSSSANARKRAVCANNEMSDAIRSLILNFHNDARRRVAKGQEPNKVGMLNPAKNMWSTSGRFSNPIVQVKSSLDNWWGEVKKVGVSDAENRYTTGALYNFANMVFSETSKIGCAYKICGGTTLVFTCLYNGIGHISNEPMWETGTACSTGSDCTTFPNSVCDDGLCTKGPPVPGKAKFCSELIEYRTPQTRNEQYVPIKLRDDGLSETKVPRYAQSVQVALGANPGTSGNSMVSRKSTKAVPLSESFPLSLPHVSEQGGD
ncbi:unnamed protein product [Haemonchus placei]|uniref:SCP domain-containing protein n=1 Tax=Haemonchus placei TaxID=6290 RepID=A0A0N4X338_HAEPC|nr:unnamed protein product [Haemonchus placei]